MYPVELSCEVVHVYEMIYYDLLYLLFILHYLLYYTVAQKILLQRDSVREANRILSRVRNQMGTACKSRTNVNLSAVHIRII